MTAIDNDTEKVSKETVQMNQAFELERFTAITDLKPKF